MIRQTRNDATEQWQRPASPSVRWFLCLCVVAGATACGFEYPGALDTAVKHDLGRYEIDLDAGEDGGVQIQPTCGSSPTGKGGDMCDVPEGPFGMGCSSGICHEYSSPYHIVTLSAYKIDKYEVTVEQYRECHWAGWCQSAAYSSDDSLDYPNNVSTCNWHLPGKAHDPVNCVNWWQAAVYCGWAGKRLPTSAEWEKAARGPDGRAYPWGDEPPASCDLAVLNDPDAGGEGCGTGGTMSVGSKPNGVSPYGTEDMIGNVEEWVSDFPDDGTYYSNSPSRDPQGPATPAIGSEDLYLIRGGGWYSAPTAAMASMRSNPHGSARLLYLGFRCAVSAP